MLAVSSSSAQAGNVSPGKGRKESGLNMTSGDIERNMCCEKYVVGVTSCKKHSGQRERDCVRLFFIYI